MSELVKRKLVEKKPVAEPKKAPVKKEVKAAPKKEEKRNVEGAEKLVADFVTKASAEGVALTKAQASALFKAVFEVVTDELIESGSVRVKDFGKFTISKREAREGINPKTREKMQIAASKSCSFKSFKTLKDLINK